MSPHATDRFTGHMPEGDPRDLMWACGGCNWPTVSAFKYLLCSTNATGVFSFLNTEGILVKPLTPYGSSWQFQWILDKAPVSVTFAILVRNFPVNVDEYRFSLQVGNPWGPFMSVTDFPRGNCNITHMLTQASVGFPVELGNTGSGFRAVQVEWDEDRPPGGWPP